MQEQKIHFRHLMIFYFRKGKSAAQTVNKICSVYGDDAVGESTVRKWFARFRTGNFELEDVKRTGRPSTVDDDQIQQLVTVNPHSTTRDIANTLGISHTSVSNHLGAAGYVSRNDIWVPHNLTEKNLLDRISISDSLLKRNVNDPFLKRLITGDEKWVLYNNAVRKKSWGKRSDPPLTTPKAGLHPKKVMLCIWWDWKGVLYYELLPHNQTIDSALYCSQLERLKAAVEQKRPTLANRKGIVFHHDNARPHVSLQTRQKLLEFGWDVIPHPPYSPDLAPTDFHLFRSLQNSLNGKQYNSLEDCKKHMEEFIAQKSEQFWEDGIKKLPERWKQVIDQNGTYIID